MTRSNWVVYPETHQFFSQISGPGVESGLKLYLSTTVVFTYICTFGFGIRPKARCFSSFGFGFGLKRKTYFRSFTGYMPFHYVRRSLQIVTTMSTLINYTCMRDRKYIVILRVVLLVVLPMSLTSWAHSLSLLRGSKTFRGAAAKASPFALIT